MTTKEEQAVKDLFKVISELREENRKFRETVTEQISAINLKTERKHLPVILEHDILQVAQKAVTDSITTVMTGYNSPLHKLILSVVEENSIELRALISDSFTEVIRMDDFKQAIVSGFSHKVARTIISNNDGLFDKVSNDLKQDAIFKSRMSLAVSNVVEECLKDRRENQ
jgi:hypothetical protein